MSVSIDDASFALELSDHNPVQNWGFENDLTGWTATGDAAIQSLKADSGSKTLKLAAGAKVAQHISINPDSSYIASVRGKVDSGGLIKIGIADISNARSAPSATTDYSLLTVGFATDAGETEGTLYLENTGAVPAYVDSVNVFEIDNTVLKGVDISYLPLIEDYNGHYSANGVRQDFFDIMQNRGVNAVMAMVFVEAGKVVGGEYTMHEGYFDKTHTIELAKRAKAHDMEFIPSFHYSDGWMSSGKGFKPEAWLDQSLSQLQTTMYNYNYDFLQSMAEAGVEPEQVKIGNEENSGIVWPDGKVWSTGRTGFAALVNAAYEAMKDVSPAMRGMLHLNNGYDTASTNQWFDSNTAHGITWDSQGYSLYGGRPTGSIYNMITNNLSKWPDKDVVFVETGFSTGSGNSIGNSYYEKSERGQYNWLIDYMQALQDAPNPTDRTIGFFYWAAEWIVEGDGYDGPNSPLLPGGTSTSWPTSVGDRTLFAHKGEALDGTYAYLWRGKPVSKVLGGQLAFTDNSASYAITPSAVTGVTMKDKSINVVKGKYKQLVATVAPADKVTNSNMIWTSSNPSVATVNPAGIVTGAGEGTATITVKTLDGGFTDSSTVTVTADTLAGSIELTGSDLLDNSVSLLVDKRSTLKAVLPEGASNKVVKLTSSDPSVVGFLGEPVQTAHPGTLYLQTNVTPDLTLIAKKDGTSTITVTAVDGSASQTLEVTVTKVPVDSVSLDAADVKLELGRTRQLKATVTPSDASFQGVTWTSSDESIATVSSAGLITAKGIGNTDITVTTDDGGKTAQAPVTVTDVHTASITLNKSSLRFRAGETEALTATVLPEDAKDKALIWTTSDSSVATVNDSGTVTAIANGTATLTVSASDGVAAPVTIPVTVADVLNVTGITLTPSSVIVDAGKTTQLTTELHPSSADNPAVSWSSSDPTIAVVDESGLVTTLRAGTAVITVKTEDGGHTASSTVTATDLLSQGKAITASKTGSGSAAANAIDGNDTTAWHPGGYVYGSTLTVDLGQTAVIDSTLVNTWNQQNFTVSVSEDGTQYTTLITHGEIVATANGVVAVTITKDKLPADTYARYIKLTINEVMKKGGTSQQYTGVNEFKVFGRFVAPVQTLTLTNVPSKLVTSDSATLTVEVTPLNADPRLTWSSSNTNAITIDQRGNAIAALIDGAQGDIVDTSIISVTAKSGVAAEATIGVKIPIIVESIDIYSNDASIQDDRLDLTDGQKVQLQASIFQGGSDYKSVTWSSDHPEVAAVNTDTGELTAIGQGIAQITLKVDSYKNLPGGMEFSVSIDVHVGSDTSPVIVPVTGVVVNPETLVLTEGETSKLTETLSPENATNSAVSWSTSDSAVAVVSTSGEVTANKAGTAAITVTTDDGAFKADVKITVKALPSPAPSYQLTGPDAVTTGQSFQLRYGLVNVTDSVYAKSATFNYDPSVMEYVDVNSLITGFDVIGNATVPGTVKIIEASTGTSSPVTGTLDLLDLTFRALAPATGSQVSISGVVLGDQFGNEVAVGSGTPYTLDITAEIPVNKAELSAVLSEASSAVSVAKVLNPAAPHYGYYPQNAIDAIRASISAATEVFNQSTATQAEVDAAKNALAQALEQFRNAASQTAGIGDLALIAARYHATSSDTDWPSLRMYDFNNNGELDLSDLVHMAQRILN
nr:Ig-like domain-containing protein [Paenibacillus phytohabitans]